MRIVPRLRYTVGMHTDKKLYCTYGTDAKEMALRLLSAADIIARIPAGARVALKPNLVVAKPPESGATTHAGVLEGVIVYLLEHGVRDISVIEGAWVGDSTKRGFSACGYDVLSKRYSVPLYDLKDDRTRRIDTESGPMDIAEKALMADYLINLPVLKGHCQTFITCALKNLKGCLPDREKRRFHAEGLHRPIAALAGRLKPALTIVDSICGDLDFEEGGTPVQTNRMLLGEDMVALDTYGCSLMGIDPADVPYIGLAERFGAGSASIGELVELGRPAEGCAFPKSSGTVKRLTKCVQEDAACSACYGSLVHALHRQGGKGSVPICIGQGFKGKRGEGLGIGNCCAGFVEYVEGCPPTAQAIRKKLK